MRPAGSVNPAALATTPVTGLGTGGVEAFTTGVPASTATVTIWLTVSTPLVAVTVNVSVVVAVAALRWAAVGVKTNAPVALLTVTVPPPVLVAGTL